MKVLLGVIAILLLAAGGLLFFQQHVARRAGVQASVAHWEAAIRVDPAAARAELERSGASLDAYDAHLLAHTFGDALYAVKGLDALSLCGDDFGWGCTHQFVADAIQEHGLSVLTSLFASCAENDPLAAFACEHGIGHGLLGYQGYSAADLDQALALCRAHDPEQLLNACEDGVFMEYNMRFLLTIESSSTAPTLRPSDPKDPLAPCDTIGAGYAYSCAYELPKWWLSSSALAGTARIRESAARCLTFDASDLRRSCFEGLGTAAAMATGLNVSATAAFCEAATDDPGDRLLCFAAAAYRFRMVDAPDYSSVCSRFGLTGTALSTCAAFQSADPNARERMAVSSE